MSGRLAGKTVLVTAAGQGIGRACALACGRAGARVVAVDLNGDALASLNNERHILQGVALDARDSAAIQALAMTHGPFDGIVNAVGFVHHGTILECDEAAWTHSLNLNVTAMYRVIRICLPAMLEAGGGSIVNIASVASSIKGVPNRFVYGTTKAAVIGLTKSVAADFVTKGVRCNAICPGTIDSPSLAERMARMPDPDQARRDFIARQPMGRIGTPEEVAALAVYLLADESGFTTGAVHVIDGGWTG